LEVPGWAGAIMGYVLAGSSLYKRPGYCCHCRRDAASGKPSAFRDRLEGFATNSKHQQRRKTTNIAILQLTVSIAAISGAGKAEWQCCGQSGLSSPESDVAV
jgi:hypothetical protein